MPFDRLLVQFKEQEKKHQCLNVAMIHAGADEQWRLKQPPRKIPSDAPASGGGGVYVTCRGSEEQCSWRRFWFGGDVDGLSGLLHFLGSATGAGAVAPLGQSCPRAGNPEAADTS